MLVLNNQAPLGQRPQQVNSSRLLFVSLWFMTLLDSARWRKQDPLPQAASEIGKVKSTLGGSHINKAYPNVSHTIKSVRRKSENIEMQIFWLLLRFYLGKQFENFRHITKSCKIHVFQIFQNILYWSSEPFESWRIHHFWWKKKKKKKEVYV